MARGQRETRAAQMILDDLAATVGRTPLVELARLASGLPGRVVAKLEMRNPCGSVKDRVGRRLDH
jgi:cysteine synthase